MNLYPVLADLALLLHLLFVLWVLLGAATLWRWPRLVRLHLPAALWGVLVELAGWPCPLTWLEEHWRRLGGGTATAASFVERLLEPVLYPGGLTRPLQIALGAGVLALNLFLYLRWLRRRPAAPRR